MKILSRVSPLHRFYLATSLGYIYFWAAIAIPYLTFRQIPLTTILLMLSVYNITASLLEYPTGVWADVHGYKKAIIIGFSAYALGNVFFLLPGGIIIPILGMGFIALGVSFISGSDYGLLNGLSNNQKKAIANYKFIADMTIFATSFAAGWLFKLNPYVTFWISIPLCILGALIISTVPEKKDRRNQGNIFATAKSGLMAVRDNRRLLSLTILFTIIFGIALCIKHIFGTLTVLYDLKPEILGMVVGVGAFIRAWGAKVYSKIDLSFGLVVGLLAISLGFSGWWTSVYLVILCLLGFQLVVGFFIAKIDHQFQMAAQDEVRASVFSFRKLTSRIFSSVYLLLFSLLLSKSTFGWIMFISALGILLVYLLVRSTLTTKHQTA